jgi:AraC-like DNA-binding protein
MPMFDHLMRECHDSPGNEAWLACCRAAQLDEYGLELDLGAIDIGHGEMRCCVAPHAMVTVVDGTFHRSIQHQCTADRDLLLLRACVSTDCEYRPQAATSWHFMLPALTLATLPRGSEINIRIHPGRHQKTLTLLLDARALHEHYGLAASALPMPLRRFVEGGAMTAALEISLALRPEAAALVHEVNHSRLSGALGRIQTLARAVELLALATAAWNSRSIEEDPPPGWSDGGILKGREASLLAQASRILLERCAQPPSLHELACQLGTNKNKINHLFRSQLGVTPQAYTRHRRIERAQALIAEGRLTLGQVADAVGYQHHSSFTTAFRDQVGMSPRDYAHQARLGLRGSALMT